MADTMISAGGGLSNSKLKLATATANDVVSGKTFYAGDKTIKTGTSLGNKFKETFNNLSGATKVLVWTNPNPNSPWPGGTIKISGQHYAAYSIMFKRYATTDSGDVSSHIAVMGASCYGSGNGYTRRVSVGNGTVWIDTPLNNGGYEQAVPFRIYGIKGTEL